MIAFLDCGIATYHNLCSVVCSTSPAKVNCAPAKQVCLPDVTSPCEEFLDIISPHFPLEAWDEDKTPFRQSLFLDANTYKPLPLFDLPPAHPDNLHENVLFSSRGNFAYQNRLHPKGSPLRLIGKHQAYVVFNGDVVFPTLINLKVDGRYGDVFPPSTPEGYRVKQGAVWMSLTPGEMLTQRPGVEKAQDTVVIGGLGLGWLLRKVCDKESVERVIVVERSKELLDWYGHDLCKCYPKVSDVICDDIYNQLGKHGGKAIYLLDIWLLYSQARQDRSLLSWKRRLKKRLWAWGL